MLSNAVLCYAADPHVYESRKRLTVCCAMLSHVLCDILLYFVSMCYAVLCYTVLWYPVLWGGTHLLAAGAFAGPFDLPRGHTCVIAREASGARIRHSGDMQRIHAHTKTHTHI
jgi:hypothetical protein